eukprot:930047-Prymnesium_polylepis.1
MSTRSPRSSSRHVSVRSALHTRLCHGTQVMREHASRLPSRVDTARVVYSSSIDSRWHPPVVWV